LLFTLLAQNRCRTSLENCTVQLHISLTTALQHQ
jgi:hypothetical protein